MEETKIHKVLKRIVALPSIPHDEKDEIKTRAHNILKAWTAHLDEIAKTEKKDAPATDEKRGSGSDGEKEKSPVVEKNGPEPPKVEEPAKEEVAGDQRVRASPEKEEVGEPMAVDEPAKEVVAEEEDFVMVDGGGEGDELAQEKAAAQDPVVEQPKPQVEEKKEAPVVGGTLEPAASSVVPPE